MGEGGEKNVEGSCPGEVSGLHPGHLQNCSGIAEARPGDGVLRRASIYPPVQVSGLPLVPPLRPTTLLFPEGCSVRMAQSTFLRGPGCSGETALQANPCTDFLMPGFAA